MIKVLRLGHRPQRDKRITTHVCLVARAFGADEVVITEKDEKIKKSVEKVVENWGGNFFVSFSSYKKVLKDWKGKIVHLTMYGIPIDEKIEELKREKDLLVIVGAERVPKEVFKVSDYNISIGNQPHSEVAALAIFLDRYFDGKQLKKQFKDARLIVKPSNNDKIVVKRE